MGLLLFVVLVSVVHALAVQVLLERPLQRLAAAMRRTQGGDFLQRVEATGEDELAELARTFNATLAAITDLHVAAHRRRRLAARHGSASWRSRRSSRPGCGSWSCSTG